MAPTSVWTKSSANPLTCRPTGSAAISGPNLSKEIADRHPAATVVACTNLDNATKVAEACTTSYFKPFVTTDVIGLEMCGSLKNVTALAVGMARGAGLR